MKTNKGLGSTKTTIISIVVLDLILMILFLFFSDLIIKDFQKSNNLSTFVISSFAIVIPGTLSILILIQFYSLFKNRFKPGNNFKKNIIYYFIITLSLVSIPQYFISVNFIKASTDNWLNNKVIKAVDIGFDMALDIENSLKKEIVQVSNSKILKSILYDGLNDKNISIDDITMLNSTISAIEYFDMDGTSLKFIGNSSLKSLTIDRLKNRAFYPKKIVNKIEIVRYQFILNIYDKPYIVVISNSRSIKFSENGYILTSVKNGLDSTTQLEMSYSLLIYYSLFSVPLILLGILVTFIFSDEIIKPLVDIENAIRKVAKGNYSYRILSKKNNEFNILIKSFNNMIKEIEKSRNKLKHTEQISTWQDIATRLAHEIRNPLTPIKLSAQRVLLKESTKDNGNSLVSTHMETIIKEVTRMEKLLNEFRDFARFPQLNISKASIKTTIDAAINIYKRTYPNINFDLSAINDLDIDMDKSQIIQVISNLTINGIHAMDSSGNIQFTNEIVHRKSQKFCKIGIKDSGHGILREDIPNLFKPYFTTKYNGSGLGLAIVNKIILDHKGKIWVESAVDVGTTFYFELPTEVRLNE